MLTLLASCQVYVVAVAAGEARTKARFFECVETFYIFNLSLYILVFFDAGIRPPLVLRKI